MFRVSGRALKILVGILVAVVVLGGVFLAVLPEVVRRVAIAQVPKLTRRILLLDDVDLNVFTGHLALKGVKVQKVGGNERAYEIDRIDVRLDYLPFLFHHVRVTEITVVAPQIQVLRRGPAEFDFSDLLDLFKGGEPSKEPSKWVVTLERVTVQRLTGIGRDQTTSPESVWRIDDFNLAANGLMIGPGARPGRLQLSFKLNDAPITVTSDSLVLAPLAAKARATVEGFDLAPVQVYLPPSVPAGPRAGRGQSRDGGGRRAGTDGTQERERPGQGVDGGPRSLSDRPHRALPENSAARSRDQGSRPRRALGHDRLARHRGARAPGGPRRSGAHRSPGAGRSAGRDERRLIAGRSVEYARSRAPLDPPRPNPSDPRRPTRPRPTSR